MGSHLKNAFSILSNFCCTRLKMLSVECSFINRVIPKIDHQNIDLRKKFFGVRRNKILFIPCFL